METGHCMKTMGGQMAKYHDMKKSLDFIREGFSKSKTPFRFTVADIAKVIDSSENTAKNVIQSINTYAHFWKGRFPPSGENFIVSTTVFERIKDRFK